VIPATIGGMPNSHFDSLAVHAGREDLTMLGVHALPLDLSSTNPLPDIERGGDSYEAMATGGEPTPDGGYVYQRLWNPTVARFESALAQLEHAETSVAYASGMAAMTAAIIASTSFSGKRHVVAVRPLYGGTDHLLASGLLGVEVTFCAEHEVAAAVRSDTALVVLETPANPTLAEVDLRALAHSCGSVPLLVDNTMVTRIGSVTVPSSCA
jgi:methionine-gamma-lyase